ncbi:cytoskeletal protein binding protein [Umbelopsis sp. WA50703]
MKYIDVCRALYDYEAGSEDELSFKEDDILYILERDDDDWYKAQLKLQQPDEIGPVGLIPANYVSEAEALGAVSAIYDYEAQQEEEVTFAEGDTMVLYDKDDPDWYLVKLENGEIGLAPSNYLEEAANEQVTHSHDHAATGEAEIQPPVSVFSALSNATDKPKPKLINDEAKSWPVHEYDVDKKKKKKSKGNLLVGNGMLCYGSETDKASPVRQYPAKDIVDYSQDSKIVHIEITGTKSATLDFQASSKSEAKAIIAKIRSSKQASTAFESATAAAAKPLPTSLPQQAPAQKEAYEDAYEQQPQEEEPQYEEQPEEPPCEPRWAIVLYSFEAQGEDEISVNEEDQVLITDYVTSDEWWKIEYEDGRAGVIPASYVQFQEDYEAALQAEEEQQQREEEEWARQQAEEEATRAAEEERKRKEEEEAWQRQQMEEEEKERRRREQEESRRREAERRRQQQEEARQRELEEKKKAARAAAPPPPPPPSAPASQPPRRNQIPAPPPPPVRPPANRSLPSDQAVNSISVPSSRSLPDRPKQAQNPGKPDPVKTRTWTDRTGSFKVEAQFLAVHDGKIRLHKINGVKIDVPIEKMCIEDIRYIEEVSGGGVAEDTSDNMPLAQLAKDNNAQRQKSQAGSSTQSWDWFDYFMKANIPMQASLRYSSAFQAENLGESDLQNLTHRRMKTLGLSETHVQRLQRFIETEDPEPPSDDEAAAAKKAKGKRNVSFGETSVIGEDTSDFRQKQIEEDERLARELQEQEDNTKSPSIFKKKDNNTSPSLQRRGTSRPTPANSAPKGINSDVFELMKDQLSTEPLKPAKAAPSTSSPSKASATVSTNESNKSQSSGGFEDDAWAPRQASPMVPKKSEPAPSPSPQVKQPNFPSAWPTQQQQQQPIGPSPVVQSASNMQPPNHVQAPPPPPPPPVMPSVQQQQQQQPVITSPARQRPIPKQSQDSKVNSQVFSQWNPSTNQSVNQQSTGINVNQNRPPVAMQQSTPTGNFQPTPVQMQPNNTFVNNQQPINNNMQQPQMQQPQMNNPQRPFIAPQSTGFIPQQQQQQQFMSPSQPQMTGMQRPPSMMVNNMNTGQGLQPAIIPANTGMSNMMSPPQNMQQFQPLQPQQTAFGTFNNNNVGRSNSAGNLPNMGINPQPTGQRSWANATPDNPFGASPQMPGQQGQQMNIQPQATGFMPQQQTGFGNGMMGANGQPGFGNTGDRYSIFKSVDPHSPSVFNGGQQQQNMMGQFVQPQQTGFQQFAQQPGNFQNNPNTGFNQQNQQPYRGW